MKLKGVQAKPLRSRAGPEPEEDDLHGNVEDCAVPVRISALRCTDSPRLNGVDLEHVHALAGVETALPPILVHHKTMSVIDGMHRIGAARLNGRHDIKVQFFYGSREDAFRLAVKANVAHGLPLTLAERQAAAARIIRTHPELSDRRIAANTGLAAKTVGAIRTRIGHTAVQLRVGRDGRVRPRSTTEGRRVASQVIAERPGVSLREIAKQAGISVGTARDVRARVLAGMDPTLPGQRGGPQEALALGTQREIVDIDDILRGLRRDPSMRYTESGRSFLSWLGSRAVTEAQWHEAIESVPPHGAFLVAKVARECARVWAEFADELDRKVTGGS